MVTKAELEAELAELRRELAERDRAAADSEAAAGADTDTATDSGAGAPDPAGAADVAAGRMREALDEVLRAHGVDPAALDLDRLWEQLAGEIGDLSRQRPALTAIALFSLGFILGRMSK